MPMFPSIQVCMFEQSSVCVSCRRKRKWRRGARFAAEVFIPRNSTIARKYPIPTHPTIQKAYPIATSTMIGVIRTRWRKLFAELHSMPTILVRFRALHRIDRCEEPTIELRWQQWKGGERDNPRQPWKREWASTNNNQLSVSLGQRFTGPVLSL
jgi:hypothetical protein